MLESARRVEVVGLQEEGGIAQVSARGTRLLEPPTISGVVYDSTASAPLAGAVVSLEGTAFQDTSDAQGRWALRPTLPGAFRVLARHARLSRLGLGLLTDSVDAGAGARLERTLAIPSIATLARQRCPAGMLSDARPLWMVGLVVDSATGLPIPGIRVSVRWLDARVARHGRLVLARGDSALVESESDVEGRWLLCGLPRDHTLQLTAAGRARTARLRLSATLEAAGVTVRESLLEVQLVASAGGSEPRAAATTLEGVRVEGQAPERGKLSTFEQRRTNSTGGRFLDREMLERRPASRLSDVLRGQLPGVRMLRQRGGGTVLSSSRTSGSSDARPDPGRATCSSSWTGSSSLASRCRRRARCHPTLTSTR